GPHRPASRPSTTPSGTPPGAPTSSGTPTAGAGWAGTSAPGSGSPSEALVATRPPSRRSGAVEGVDRPQPPLDVVLEGPHGQVVDLRHHRPPALAERGAEAAAQHVLQHGHRLGGHRRPLAVGADAQAARLHGP